MSVSVNFRRPKMKSGSRGGGGLGQIAGAALGFALGGPAGAGLGMQLGGALGNQMNPAQASSVQQGPGGVATDSPQAMQRREAHKTAQQDLGTLENGLRSLSQLPPELQQEYAKPLMGAYMMAKKGA